ncbi:MAG: hypothetical protein MZV64_21730 [Ignavibacteriales bacterium]|nr:hypothetical protein [Ignavibacteriales bacterium]
MLHQFNVTYDSARSELNSYVKQQRNPKMLDQQSPLLPDKKTDKTKTPVLDNFGRDLNKACY